MAYTTIDNPTEYFNTVLYTGNNTDGNSVTGVGFQPDWCWIKMRSSTASHALVDSVRGRSKTLRSDGNDSEFTSSSGTDFKSFDSDGFTVDNVELFGSYNNNGVNIVTWNWLAGGTAPAITYSVKVVSDSGNKYRFDDFGTSAVTLDLQEGGTYTFDQSDSSNSGHPLRFYTASDKSGGEYTTGVTTSGTPGSSGAKTVITVTASAPTLYYQCSNHAGMGGQANTNSTFGSSNFGGSIQSTVSANTTAGFSIISFTSLASGSNYTIAHGLSATPAVIFLKGRHESNNWMVYHHKNTSAPETDYLMLDDTAATADYPVWNDTAPTSSVFSCGTWSGFDDGGTMIAYCFAEKKGFSKFGSYTGNGDADGSYIHLGFKPAFVMIKVTSTTSNWGMFDNKRLGFNPKNEFVRANETNTESSDYDGIDFLSNGFKLRTTSTLVNAAQSYIYMAFAESPFVNSAGAVPTNAR